MGKVIKNFAIFTLILLLCSGAAVVYIAIDYNKAINEPISTSEEIVELTIEEGETIDQITAKLKEAGLIRSELYFKFYIRQKSLESKLQAGAFKIPKNSDAAEVAEALQHAVFPDIWVTIPEGMMASDIAELIDEEFSQNPDSAFVKADFLTMVTTTTPELTVDLPIPAGKPLEGYLYPDTYRFPPDATAEYVLHTMLENLKAKIYDPYKRDLEQTGYSFYEMLILASMLERETMFADDRPLVADLLYRRLENGWLLQIDATLLYHFGDWKHVITEEDLQLDTPYNTYIYAGLPPTPIANPGQNTILAMLDPESNEYWYYVSDTDGHLHYATTLEEHNQNVNTYVR